MVGNVAPSGHIDWFWNGKGVGINGGKETGVEEEGGDLSASMASSGLSSSGSNSESPSELSMAQLVLRRPFNSTLKVIVSKEAPYVFPPRS